MSPLRYLFAAAGGLAWVSMTVPEAFAALSNPTVPVANSAGAFAAALVFGVIFFVLLDDWEEA